MKRIELTKGKYAIVDDADYNFLMQWRWFFNDKGKYGGYAVRSVTIDKKTRNTQMHRELMNPPKGMEVDHKNGDRLDNRRSNLRVCTHAQNCANRRMREDNKSGFRGVHQGRGRNTWTAQIRLHNKQYFIGNYKTKIEASRAYQKAAKKLFGDFVRQ
jgi:hypothetical protein